MERLLLVWDELDDWAGIARHFASSMTNRFKFSRRR